MDTLVWGTKGSLGSLKDSGDGLEGEKEPYHMTQPGSGSHEGKEGVK